ncbi:pyrin [Sciurus carolinensis]|uniref:pyrin n=1 Tax=Sciurus carolinensis TaxID=30640 RepID=UPI001FB50BBC|nr:pyrin [Sciurus carolinensis]
MAKTLSDHLLSTLEELVPYDFEKFKFKLQNTNLEKEHSRIPRGHLQMARPVRLATLLITHYGEEYAVQLTLQVLRAINQRLLAEELHRATGQGYPTQDSGTDTSTGSSSGENKPKSQKEPDGPEDDGQQQSGGGLASLPSSQHEAGRGPQKKSQSKRRDQKGSEVLDVQGKPLSRSTGLPSRRSLVLAQLPGDKEIRKSAQLRRNASSAGRLQGLSSGAPGRKESKKSEVYLHSVKQRPRSFEFTVSSEERESPNPETLLTSLAKMRNAKPDSAASPRGIVILDGEATVTLEKGYTSPEHSMVLTGKTVRNTLCNALLAREEKSISSWEEHGVRDAETQETLEKMTGSVCPESSNSEVPLSSGRPQDEAAFPLCHTQKGDLLVGTSVLDSCSCPVASGEPETLRSHLPSCLQCQASLRKKSSGGLSPEPLPQCKRHMKQVQLLFCEDHGEPICLICRLSQEHRGHRVRPIEEAALEYREQIQKQLEHLKELRKSGEEQRSQGEKKTEHLLKQTETQKERVRCQLKQLCQFLEQQEQLFVAWLEELDQTIGQVRETFDTQVFQHISVLDELIGELEAKQSQSEWEIMQDVGVTLHRAKTMTVPEPWAAPPEVKEKIHLLYQKIEFVEKSTQHFTETLRSEMETLNVPELIAAQAHSASVILDPATAHPNLVFSDDMKSVRLGNRNDWLPDSPERFKSCIITLGSPSFFSGRHYWEVEVGDKTAWVLGVCKASVCRKGSMTLSPENGCWVVMMKQNEYQASTCPPTRLQLREPPRRVGIFLDWKNGDISFYNVTARSPIYKFTGFSSSGPLQPIFSPGTHDGGKNMGPLTICPVGGQGPY